MLRSTGFEVKCICCCQTFEATLAANTVYEALKRGWGIVTCDFMCPECVNAIEPGECPDLIVGMRLRKLGKAKPRFVYGEDQEEIE